MWKINKKLFFNLQSEKEDVDPFADTRRQTIAEKEDEYRQRRRRLVISPERADPFADGLYSFLLFSLVRSIRIVFVYIFQWLRVFIAESIDHSYHFVVLNFISNSLILDEISI